MTPIKQTLEMLAKRLQLTASNDEPEEYILTKEEEVEATNYAITRAKDAYQTKHLELGDRLIDIEVKISEINWEREVDIEYVLKNCNSNKLYQVWLKNKKEQERLDAIKKYEELKKKYTAKFIYNIMAWTSENVYGKKLVVNNWNRNLITTICFFISGDERFETELGYSFKKGLLIRGISGLGKTFLFNCVKTNELLPITIVSMVEISEEVKENGHMQLPEYKGIIYLDDVGTEEATINHYGTKINFFKNFIEKYYLNNISYNRLIVSTNNSFSELEEKYGFRVRSRMKDMFNIITVDGTDMRG